MDIDKMIEDYKEGYGIYDICAKYKIGKIRLKEIFSAHGVEFRKRGKQPMDKSSFIVKDYRIKKYAEHEGYHYVAIDKKNGTRFNDYMNTAGLLTSHIEGVYGVKIPTLHDRRKYYMLNGNYWWEQWFDIVEEKDAEHLIKCPYCDWGTDDIQNKSGTFTYHLHSVHHISVKEHLENYPQYYKYFSKQVTLIEKEKHLEDPRNYVICPICSKKMSKITHSHLKNAHGMYMNEFKNKYPNAKLLSDEMVEQVKKDMKLGNLTVSKNRFISSYEKEISEYLNELGVEHDANRQILIGKEIDILIPSKKIGIEFNGLKWHSENFGKKDKNYHLNKTLMCNEKGYGLLHIFEDEYVNHKDIVLARIKHILGEDYDLIKVQGRKTEIKEISNIIAKEFLEKYHLEGFQKSNVYVGGFYKDELIAVMTFKNDESSWEITRCVSNYHYLCQGVGGKIFSYFTRKYKPSDVFVFADRRWTLWHDDNLFIKLGFKLEETMPPRYTYYNEKINKYKRMNKVNEIAEFGYDKIWDCGIFKYVWKRTEKEE